MNCFSFNCSHNESNSNGNGSPDRNTIWCHHTRIDIDFKRTNSVRVQQYSIRCPRYRYVDNSLLQYMQPAARIVSTQHHRPIGWYHTQLVRQAGAIKACAACFISIKTIIAVLLQAVLSGRHNAICAWVKVPHILVKWK